MADTTTGENVGWPWWKLLAWGGLAFIVATSALGMLAVFARFVWVKATTGL